MNYHFQSKEGQIHMPSEFARTAFKKHLLNNEGAIFDIVKRTPESRVQRKYYHGAVLRLWAYLDGKDYKSSTIINQYHEIAKIEWNGEIVVSMGKTYKIGKSTQQRLNNGFLEDVITYLEENYGIDRQKCLDPKLYKKFMVEVYPFDLQYETFIDYLVALNLLR